MNNITVSDSSFDLASDFEPSTGFEENDNGEKINYEFKEKLKSKSSETNSENEDDLLQIPAFLRRQAN